MNAVLPMSSRFTTHFVHDVACGCRAGLTVLELGVGLCPLANKSIAISFRDTTTKDFHERFLLVDGEVVSCVDNIGKIGLGQLLRSRSHNGRHGGYRLYRSERLRIINDCNKPDSS